MEGAHQHVHRDHSPEREGGGPSHTERVPRVATENARQQCHEREDRRSRETQLVGYTERVRRAGFTTVRVAFGSAGIGVAHALSLNWRSQPLEIPEGGHRPAA